MAVAKKKYKIFKICKELNLGHDTIRTFLESKKIKVSGPNDSVGEDVYIDVLERFASDKEKAEQLKARKTQAEAGKAEGTAKDAPVPKEESSYMQALKQSIEDGVEALSRPEEKKPEVRKRPKKVEAHKPEPKEIAEKEETVKAAEEKPKVKEGEEVPETAKPEKEIKPEAAEKKEDKAEKKKDEAAEAVAEKTKDKKLPLEADKAKAVEKEKQDKAKKKKLKTKDHKQHEADEQLLSEKDKKHRKALEMIRKDKDEKKKGKRFDTISEEGKEIKGRQRRGKKKRRKQVDQKEVEDTIKKTLASIDSKTRKPKRHKKAKTEAEEAAEDKVIHVTEFISANDLANLMDVDVSDILTKCLELGLVVTINQRLDLDTISLLADEYGYRVEEQYVSEFVDEGEEEEEEDQSKLEPRSPIVTIMGHVDHGKTSLLDYLRHSNIVSGEAGGITQHIGAYELDFEGKKITFLDTPGHEAFTAMRARGAQVTDIVILIVAADDAVMPQTVEALDHAKAAGVRIVIAINKTDKPNADAERIKQQLAERDILVEDWGGQYQCAEISAKNGAGISDLLEKLLLESEMLDLKADPHRRATGVVIESRLDKGKGPIATVLVQKGTLNIGDNFIAGNFYGKVRALLNEREDRLESVHPSQPAVVVGFIGVPQAGDRFMVTNDERTAREISTKRMQLKREQDAKQVKLMTLQQISDQIQKGDIRDLPILVKADVDGSAEALADSLIKLNTEEVKVNVIRKAVGPISESDVLLASASGAVIIGFHVRANPNARELAGKENVDIRLYRVIYDAINDIKLALEGLLKPAEEENVIGQAEVRETFKISRLGVIAGCHVLSGKITRNNRIRLVRDDVEIYTGNVASLKRFKEDTREVASGFECGIQIENYNDIKEGDIIESFEVSQVKRKLE